MKIDAQTVQKICKLSRLKLSDEKAKAMETDLSQIMTWIESLSEANTDNVEPMFAVNLKEMPQREDVVNDGDYVEKIVKNAPENELNMFVVPKVVE